MNRWALFVRQTTALCLLLAVGLAVILLTVKHQVQRLEEDLADLNKAIVEEQESIKVLNAEFSLLIEPERLRRLATQYLGLQPIEPTQLSSVAILQRPRLDAPVEPKAGAKLAAAGHQQPRLAAGIHPAAAEHR